MSSAPVVEMSNHAVILRPYNPETDATRVAELFKAIYPNAAVPDFQSPLMLTTLVSVDATGQVIGFSYNKVTVQNYTLLDANTHVRAQGNAFRELQAESAAHAWEKGVDEMVTFCLSANPGTLFTQANWVPVNSALQSWIKKLV
jgi:hypothetical protein